MFPGQFVFNLICFEIASAFGTFTFIALVILQYHFATYNGRFCLV